MAEAVIPEKEKVMRDKDKVSLIIDPTRGQTTVLGTGAGNMRAISGSDANAEIRDPTILVSPTISGPHGRAWLCDLVAGRHLLGFREEDDATLVHWVVEAPWAHPFWNSYSILLIHLRPMPDARETVFYLPDATHEFHVYALDPEKGREPLIKTGIPRQHWLQPANFVAQFIEISDDLARDRIRAVVQEICDGKLSPDTDWRSEWVARFNDKMIKREFR